MNRSWLLLVSLGLLVAFALGLLTGRYALDSEREVTPTVTVPVGMAASPQEPMLTLDLDNEFEQADSEEADDLTPEEGLSIHEDLRDEQPPGAPEDAAEKVMESEPMGMVEPLPLGGAQNYSCRRHLVRNFSDRASNTRVMLFVVHYAVIRPVFGALGIIHSLFDRPSFGASSHLGLHPDGRCELWVDYSKKAWTQGPFNSASESVEIMAYGDESRAWWIAQPIIKKGILAAIIADRLRARGLSPDKVDPVGCGVQRAGWTDHDALECGMTHHDVKPNFPYDVVARQVKLAYAVPTAAEWPVPIPKWFWRWAEWKLGRGVYKGHASDPARRPASAPRPIPKRWPWLRLAALSTKGEV